MNLSKVHHIWMCPVCQQPLIASGRQFACDAGHSFDVAREGYVNLILAHQRSSDQAGDPPDSLRHRRAFLEAGHYQPLAATLTAIAGAHIGATAARGQVLDTGCGEGYLLRCLRAGIPTECAGFHGIDISRTAVRLAARASSDIAFAAGNAFRLPVLSAVVQVLVVMMAPLDEAEARRVLVEGGILISVVPGADHLGALRALAYAEAQPHALKQMPSGFRMLAEERVRFPLQLTSPESVSQLLEMTPYKWHMDPPTYARARILTSLADTAHFVVRVMEPK